MPPNKNPRHTAKRQVASNDEKSTIFSSSTSSDQSDQLLSKDVFIDMSANSTTQDSILIVRESDAAKAIASEITTATTATESLQQQPIDQTLDSTGPRTDSDHHNSSSNHFSGATSDLDDEASLDALVTKLYTSNGGLIYLIGTAHFSKQSVNDVQQLIRFIRPSAVLLELCRERAFMLGLDEESLLEQNRKLSFEKIRGIIAEKGLAHGLIYITFIKMSASITEKLGLAPGAEFRAGSAEAQKIPNCCVILADRELGVTVARAVASVSLWQKMKLIYQVLKNDVSITQEDVEKCKDKDMLEQMLQELGGEFPGFKRVLLDERNVFLAHTIYNWAQNYETSRGPQKAVAIVGIGHVAGIVEHWGKTTDEQVIQLLEVPKTSRTRLVVTKTIKYCALALFVYVGYRTIVPSSIQTAISNSWTSCFDKRLSIANSS